MRRLHVQLIGRRGGTLSFRKTRGFDTVQPWYYALVLRFEVVVPNLLAQCANLVTDVGVVLTVFIDRGGVLDDLALLLVQALQLFCRNLVLTCDVQRVLVGGFVVGVFFGFLGKALFFCLAGSNTHGAIGQGHAQCRATQTTGQRFLRGLTRHTGKRIHIAPRALQSQVGRQAFLATLQTFEWEFTGGCGQTSSGTLANTFCQGLLGSACLRTNTTGEQAFCTSRTGCHTQTTAKQDLVQVLTDVALRTRSGCLRFFRGFAVCLFSLEHRLIDVLFYSACTLGATDRTAHRHDGACTQIELGQRQCGHHRHEGTQRRSCGLYGRFKDVEQTGLDFFPSGAGLFGLLHASSLRLQLGLAAGAQALLKGLACLCKVAGCCVVCTKNTG